MTHHPGEGADLITQNTLPLSLRSTRSGNVAAIAKAWTSSQGACTAISGRQMRAATAYAFGDRQAPNSSATSWKIPIS